MRLLQQITFGNVAYYGMRVIVVAAIFLFLWYRDWVDAVSAALILFLMFVPSILREKYDLYLPFELELAIVMFIFVALFLGSLRNFYERVPWWDALLHFQSGILLGVVGFVLIYLLNESRAGQLTLSPFFVSFFAACFSIATGVIWEIYEFTADAVFGFTMQRSGLPDTMKDLILNTVGAIAVAAVAYAWVRIRQRVPFTPRRLAGSRYDRSKKEAS